MDTFPQKPTTEIGGCQAEVCEGGLIILDELGVVRCLGEERIIREASYEACHLICHLFKSLDEMAKLLAFHPEWEEFYGEGVKMEFPQLR